MVFSLGFLALLAIFIFWLSRGVFMPGQSWPVPITHSDTAATGDLAERLRRHVEHLAIDIGPRHQWNRDSLERSACYIEQEFRRHGYEVRSQRFRIDVEQTEFRNLEVELPGRSKSEPLLVVGAHYDTVPGSPGADDNASGVAAVLEIARVLRSESLRRTLRLVAFANEEEPYAGTDGMGSIVYARALHSENTGVYGMLALESLGYYDDAPNSQDYPWPIHLIHRSQANFLAFVSNARSRRLLRTTIASFRSQAKLASEGLSIPEWWASDIGRSDHAAFWREGYPALMITDTVPFRNPHYHEPSDEAATLDYPRFSLAVAGLIATIRELTN